ncbi:MAG: CHRD domain-containing protein [Actinomycetota bacterium]
MRRTSIISLLVAAGTVVAVAFPGWAAAQFTTVQATLSGAGDPDGSGSAVLEFDTKEEAVCYEIHTENVTTPITGAAITSNETGEEVIGLLVIDDGPDLVECVALGRFKARSRQGLRAIGKDPGDYSLELYNDEHPSAPGAVRGRLEGVS